MAIDRDIAIVGMSCYFPGAKTMQEFWDNLVHGVDSITDAPADRIDPKYFANGQSAAPDRFYFKRGGFIDPITVDPLSFGLLPISVESMDPEQLVSLHLVKEALTDAGVYEKNISLQKCCYILGKAGQSGLASFRIAEYIYQSVSLEIISRYICPGIQQEEVDKITKEYQTQLGRFQPDSATGAMSNLVVSQVVNKLDMKGPAYSLDAACASSLIAIEQAISYLLTDQCDLAVAGGMHLSQGASFWSIFNILGAASHKGEISPFNEDADGILIGEGAGLVVMKRLEKAVADNDRIYAVIKACGSSSDGSDVSVLAPSSKGQIATLRMTWERSGMDPQKLGYLETHGTATQVGDRTEIATMTDFFGNNTAPQALFGSVKSNIGHTMCAAGIAGLIKTVLALYYRKIPPTLHCEKPMKGVFGSRFRPVQELTDWDEEKYPLVAAVNAFGFGGINSHLILEPYAASTDVKLFEEAQTMKKEVLEMMEESLKKQNKMQAKVIFAYQPISDFPAFREAVQRYAERINGGALPGALPALSEEELEDPILQEVNNNLREIIAIQNSMLKWYQSGAGKRKLTSKAKTGSVSMPLAEFDKRRIGQTFEKTNRFDLEHHPYLMDHMIVRQPAYRPLEEKDPIVPFAMTLETFCEMAEELLPGKKVLSVGPAKVLRWLPVKTPFVAPVTGVWKTEDTISWNLPEYASGDITLGDSFPPVPEEYTKEIDLGDDHVVPQIPKKDRIYSLFLFHGPRYQSIIELVKLTKKGLRAHIYKAEGKGSMLDNLGQLLGLWGQITFEENRTTFPMRVEELIFYQDFHDQKGIFEYTMLIKDIKETEVETHVVIKRNEKVWCVVNGWFNQRLRYSQAATNAIMIPDQCILAKELNDNVFYYFNDPQTRVSILDFLSERYLNLEERKHHSSLYPNQARDFLFSRIALKDGVRKYIQKEEDPLIYPIEISVGHDEKGKPYVFGHAELNGIEVSIAHKGSESVVMVSDQPVGIDIEKIEERKNGFIDNTFTPHELELLNEKEDKTEWIARFWVAKEAYGKMLGLGLQGNPKRYEIESVNGEDLLINNTIIRTTKHRNDFVIGWTQK